MGSLEPRKNLSALLKALKYLRFPVTLVLSGWQAWGEKSWLRPTRIQSSGASLALTGYVDDETLAALYSGALALVYPSVYEGFGLPILEAMACDCPVVCSNTSSMPEVAGDAAHFVNPTNPMEIAAALEKVYSDAACRNELIRLGRLRVQDFSWVKTARATVELFQKLAR